MKTCLLAFLLCALLFASASCAGDTVDPQLPYGVPEVVSVSESDLHQAYYSIDEMVQHVQLIVVGKTSEAFEQRDSVVIYQHGQTLTTVEILEIFQNNTGTELNPGNQIELAERCGYQEGIYKGTHQRVFVRDEGQFPIAEDRPYLLFIIAYDAGAYWTTFQGQYDLTRATPTEYEVAGLTPSERVSGSSALEGVLAEFTAMKAQAIQHPLFGDALQSYLGKP